MSMDDRVRSIQTIIQQEIPRVAPVSRIWSRSKVRSLVWLDLQIISITLVVYLSQMWSSTSPPMKGCERKIRSCKLSSNSPFRSCVEASKSVKEQSWQFGAFSSLTVHPTTRLLADIQKHHRYGVDSGGFLWWRGSKSLCVDTTA